jgi:hypothetical protein
MGKGDGAGRVSQTGFQSRVPLDVVGDARCRHLTARQSTFRWLRATDATVGA